MFKNDEMLFALLGRPVKQSLSPLIHNYMFEKEGVPGFYMAVEIEEGNLEMALERLGVLSAPGGNVTIPYKEEIIPYLSGVTERAKLIGAVNTLFQSHEGFMGDNTDGEGLMEALKEEDWHPEGKKIMFLGAGGSARSAAITFAQEGAAELIIVNRDLNRAEKIKEIIEENTAAKVRVLGWEDADLGPLVGDMDAVFNTTPLGMVPNVDEMPPLPLDALGADHFVFDVIYNPEETMFLKAAKERGAKTANGLKMLIQQARLSFELWTGIPMEEEDLVEKICEYLVECEV